MSTCEVLWINREVQTGMLQLGLARQGEHLSCSRTSGHPRLSAQEPNSNSNVKSVLLYGCETWRTTKIMLQKIQTFFNTCLRRIYKIRWPEKIKNEDLLERAGQEPVAKQILRRKWGWIGHALRKPASSITPSPDLEPTGKEEERPAFQQLEARHGGRTKAAKKQLGQDNKSSPEQSALERGC